MTFHKRSTSVSVVLAAALAFSWADAQRFRHVDLQPVAPQVPELVSVADSVIAAIDDIKGPAMEWSLLQIPPVFAGYQREPQPDLGPGLFDSSYALSAAADSTSIIPPAGISPADGWLRRGRKARRFDRWLVYDMMLRNPGSIRYAMWKLPEPVKLMRDVYTRASFVVEQELPEPVAANAELSEPDIRKRHWIHDLDAGIQFSQAYLSPNWYQGGNNNLSLLAHFIWNVRLNPVFHPNAMLESNLQYKLGLYSTPQDQLHKYSISEDLFEWNFKTGFKAVKKWFYSLTMRFKTQFLNNYVKDEPQMSAAFLTPGEFTAGLGMTYSTANSRKTIVFNASISPVSYNLKTCINSQVDPTQFSMKPGQKTVSQIGSTAEVTFDWALATNIRYKSRLFLFSNYKYFIGDWENTLSFAVNRFLSTQIYAHLRYDTSADVHYGHWRHWMVKEILSFGFQYTFSTTGKK